MKYLCYKEEPGQNTKLIDEKKYQDHELDIKAAYLTGDFTLKEKGDHYEKHYARISRIIK